MDASAKLRFVRLSPQKGRLVADLIRGKRVEDALNILSFETKKSAHVIKGVLRSAMANADEKDVDDVDSMVVSMIKIDGGPVHKRQMPRARGRATKILKRTSHITLTINECE